jgi:hypothetical protein
MAAGGHVVAAASVLGSLTYPEVTARVLLSQVWFACGKCRCGTTLLRQRHSCLAVLDTVGLSAARLRAVLVVQSRPCIQLPAGPESAAAATAAAGGKGGVLCAAVVSLKECVAMYSVLTVKFRNSTSG